MSNSLTKNPSPSYSAYSGSPGTPFSPGYTTTSTVTSTTYIPIYSNTPQPGYSPTTGANAPAPYVAFIPVTSTTTVTTTVPATQATAPTAPAPTNDLSTYNLGWNAGARSINTIAGDGYAQFSATTGTQGGVVGLAGLNPTYAYTEVQYGFYFHAGTFTVMEGGTQRTAPAVFAATDVFTVLRTGTLVRYYQNSLLVYTSAVPSYGTLAVESTLYAAGDSITNASIGSGVPSGIGYTATSSTALQPLAINAGHQWNDSSNALQPLTLSATAKQTQGATVSLQPLAAMSANRKYASSSVSMAPMTTSASYGSLMPQSTRSATQLVPLTAKAHSLTGTITLHTALPTMQPLATLASNKPYAAASVSMQPATVMSGYLAKINGYAYLGLTGKLAVSASGTGLNPNAAALTGPSPKAVGYVGAQAAVTGPSPKLTIAGTIPNVGRITATIGSPIVSAHGFGGSYSTATLRPVQSLSMRAYTGAQLVSATLHDGFVLSAKSTQDNVGRLTATLPLFQVVASGTGSDGAVLNATLPMIAPTPSARLNEMLPDGYVIEAVGSAVVAVAYEAYAINLRPPGMGTPQEDVNAVTHFEGFPFDQIIRFGTDYYGVAKDGMYLIGGDTDNGAAIPWYFQTAETDFGETALKRVVSLTIGGNVTTDIIATVTAEPPELPGTRVDYDYVTQRSSAAQNARVNTGKGLRSRYYSFGLSDDVGNMANIDSLDIEADALKRSR